MQDKEIQELIEKIKKYANDVDVSLVEKAYYFGKKAHDGQFRKSGEPYFIHPVAVANILCDMELDIETIINYRYINNHISIHFKTPILYLIYYFVSYNPATSPPQNS